MEICSAKVASYVRIKTRSHPKRSEAKGVPSTGWAPDFGLEPWKNCGRGGRIQNSNVGNLCAFRSVHIFTVKVPSCHHHTAPKDLDWKYRYPLTVLRAEPHLPEGLIIGLIIGCSSNWLRQINEDEYRTIRALSASAEERERRSLAYRTTAANK